MNVKAEADGAAAKMRLRFTSVFDTLFLWRQACPRAGRLVLLMK